MQKIKNNTMGVFYGIYDGKEKIGKYFTLGEFLRTEYTDIDNIPDDYAYQNLKRLAKVLDIFRDKFGAITITSGYRSPALQAELKRRGNEQAAAYSLHQEGLAADITPLSTSAKTMFATVAGTPELAKLVGEFALKTSTIHMTLPVEAGDIPERPSMVKEQVFMYVDAANKYIRYGAQELANFIQANYKKIAVAGGIGLGVIGIIGGGLLAFFIIRKKMKIKVEYILNV